MTILFDKNIYDLNAIKRAIVNFKDDLYANITQDGNNFIIDIEIKNNEANSNNKIKEFKNNVIEEDVRISIEKETKEIRDSIYKMTTSSYLDEDVNV